MFSFENTQAASDRNSLLNDARSPGDAMKLLREHACVGEMHDAPRSYNGPRCHPNTRISTLDTIHQWTEGDGPPILWLHGPAGAGKSAIVQTIVDRMKERTMPCASFQFSRATRGQSNIGCLAPTLAYQLAMASPIIRTYIVSAITRDPTLFEKSLADQFRYLLLLPLEATVAQVGSFPNYIVIAIDGLDECPLSYKTLSHEEQQRQILEIAMVATQEDLPIRFLIASRSAHIIRQCFEHNPAVQPLLLPEAKGDIRLYLDESFKIIKDGHPSIHHEWPSSETIQQLVDISYGQFLYASTLIRHLSAPCVDPETALSRILEVCEWGSLSQPFAQLDSLYIHFLNSVPMQSRGNMFIILQHLVWEDCLFEEPHYPSPNLKYCSPQYFAQILSTTSAQIYADLVNLHSILDIPLPELASKQPIRSIHASLGDFLRDPVRSRVHSIGGTPTLRVQSMGCDYILKSLFSSNPKVAIHLVYIIVYRAIYLYRKYLPQKWIGLLPDQLFIDRSVWSRLLLLCDADDLGSSPLEWYPIMLSRNVKTVAYAACMVARMCILGTHSPESQVFDKWFIFPAVFSLARVIGALQATACTTIYITLFVAGLLPQRPQIILLGLCAGLRVFLKLLSFAYFLPFLPIIRLSFENRRRVD